MCVPQHPLDIAIRYLSACLDKNLAPSNQQCSVFCIEPCPDVGGEAGVPMWIGPLKGHCYTETPTHGNNKLKVLERK